MKGTSVAVVGGGPAGMLCAAQFAKHGALVTVFERASEVESEEKSGWNITLGQTAKRAIEAAGLSTDFGPEWRYALPQLGPVAGQRLLTMLRPRSCAIPVPFSLPPAAP